MILPADTKVPLSLSDDEDEFDLTPSTQDVDTGYPSYSAPDAYDALSPSAENVPFLFNRTDIELSPPPYTAFDARGAPKSRKKRLTAYLQSSKGRTTLRAGCAIVILYFLGLWVTIRWIIPHRRPRQPFAPPPPGPEWVPESWRDDGEASACATFSAVSAKSFPSGLEMDPPSPVDGGTRRAANATFLISTRAGAELFTSLRGAAEIGTVFVTAYDADEEEELDTEAIYPALTGVDGKQIGRPGKGEYARVTVEAIFDMLPGVPSDAIVSAANSPGWAMLEASRACAMLRNGSFVGPHHSHHPPDERSTTDVNWEEASSQGMPRAVGVGIHTAAANGSQANFATTPLRFRLHIALPRFALSENDKNPDPPPLVEVILDSFSGAHRRPQPRAVIPPLKIRGGESVIRVGNITGVQIAGLHITSTVGKIEVVDARAEGIHLSTLGDIRAKVTVSTHLDVHSPAGEINLDLSLARSPSYSYFEHPDPFQPAAGNETDAECRLNPIRVSVNANNNNVTIRHSGWAVPCRTLSENLRSMVGSIDVKMHLAFEGPLRLSTTVGVISVEEVPHLSDPLDLGRWRNVTLEKQGRHGAQVYTGSVKWETASDPGTKDEVDAETLVTGGVEAARGHPDWRRAPGLNIETSVGSIAVSV